MRPIPVLLLNVALVGIGLFAYDQLRDDAPSSPVTFEGGAIDLAALERRIEALEARGPQRLRGAEPDADLLARLEALEDVSPPHEPLESVAPPSPTDAPAREADAETMPSEAQIALWQKIREAVRRQESIARNRKRFDPALDRLGLHLTPRQRERIHEAYTAFEPRIHEIWEEAKAEAQATAAAGGTVDRQQIVMETTNQIQQAFAETLSGVVHDADAPLVAGAMIPGPGKR